MFFHIPPGFPFRAFFLCLSEKLFLVLFQTFSLILSRTHFLAFSPALSGILFQILSLILSCLPFQMFSGILSGSLLRKFFLCLSGTLFPVFFRILSGHLFQALFRILFRTNSLLSFLLYPMSCSLTSLPSPCSLTWSKRRTPRQNGRRTKCPQHKIQYITKAPT